jgi:hypothetical protein
MKTTLFFFCFLIGGFHLYSQQISKQVIGSSGEPLSNGTHTINFTVGEPIVGIVQNNAAILQGFWAELLNDDTLSVSSIVELENWVSVYPNPVVNYLKFNFNTQSVSYFKVGLFDVSGKLLIEDTLKNQNANSQLDLSHLSSGIYLLKITASETNYNKSIKIIKN